MMILLAIVILLLGLCGLGACWRIADLNHRLLVLRTDMLMRWRNLILVVAEDSCFGDRCDPGVRHADLEAKLRHQLEEMARELDIKEES